MTRILAVLGLLGALMLGGCPWFTEAPAPPEGSRPARPPSPGAVRVEARPPQPRPAPAPVPVPAPAPPPGAGDVVAARHILVQYQGSARAGANVTRDKDEARTRAEDVARRAKAPGADFEALAREFSDGPTNVRGGDLGQFGRGRMHPDFERSAFGLAPGQVSDVVETPFGFHVIQRYR